MRAILPLLVVAIACGGGNSSTATTELGSIRTAARTGALGNGDRDYFGFSAAIGGQLRVAIEMPAGADLDLALFDASGALLATSRSNVGAVERLFATVAQDDAYTVEVSGTGGAYRFTIAIEEAVPSVSTAIGSLGAARSFHAAIALPDGGALIAGGTSDPSSPTNAILNALATTEWFDAATGQFAAGPDLGGARFGLTATLLPTGRVLLAGGDMGATADLVSDGELNATIPMTGGIRALATATLLPDGRVLIAGGTTVVFDPLPTARTLDSTTIFDPKTRTFSEGPRLRASRSSHAAVLARDGRVLIVGGVGRADSEWIDVDAGSSVVGPAMSRVRDDLTATLLRDGSVLVAGGQDATGRSLDSAEVLDPGSAAFRLLGDRMADPRADHEAVLLPNGDLLLIGGEDDPAGGPDVILTSIDRFDPATETFAPAPPLVVPRDDHRVAHLRDGRILVTGGEDATSTSIAATEIHLPD